MNKRIRELYEQALEQHVSNNSAWEELNPEKFAELIVQECADVCQSFGESGDGYTCSYEILEHFGVEE